MTADPGRIVDLNVAIWECRYCAPCGNRSAHGGELAQSEQGVSMGHRVDTRAGQGGRFGSSPQMNVGLEPSPSTGRLGQP
jgi:hypothetical protein